jgi:hypothetical protein
MGLAPDLTLYAFAFGTIVVAGAYLWVRLARSAANKPDDDEGDDDDGGGLFRPPPPEPTRPVGGPPDDHWSEFDRARAAWERDRTSGPV